MSIVNGKEPIVMIDGKSWDNAASDPLGDIDKVFKMVEANENFKPGIYINVRYTGTL